MHRDATVGRAGSGGGRKLRYPAYSSREELGHGLKKGSYFKGPIRVNAHDRSQAYITLPGLPSDLMIRVRPLIRTISPFKSIPTTICKCGSVINKPL